MALTQTQLTLLRKLVQVSSSIASEGGSIEFMVNVTHNTGTCVLFFGARSQGIENVSQSDLNELRRSGYVITTRFSQRGSDILQVANEAFELFREEDIVESAPSRFTTGDAGLDDLLDAAITRYRVADMRGRNDALEKLWDLGSA